MTTHRIVVAFVMALCTTLPVYADDAEMKKTAKAKAIECQEALIKGNYEAFVDLTHPKVVEGVGGREKMIEKMSTGMKAMKAKGLEFKSAKFSDPSDPVAVGKDLYITVPFTLEVAIPGARGTSNNALVGISSDGGKTWMFIDTGPGRDTLKKLFPDLPDKLPIPKKEPPKFVKE
jgi:hypothetical protein